MTPAAGLDAVWIGLVLCGMVGWLGWALVARRR